MYFLFTTSWKLVLATAFASLFLTVESTVLSQDNTEEPASEISVELQEKLDQLKSLVTEAGKQFKAASYSDSADTVRSAQELLIELAETGLPEIHAALENDYTRIKKAQELLRKHDQKFTKLKELDEYLPISFVSTVAPIIMEYCGKCHVEQSKGSFSAVSFKSMLDAESIVAGEPDDSPIIEIIESGDMPPARNKKVSSKDLDILKQWVAAGAKFDGEDESTNLGELKPGSSGPKKTFR